MIDKANYQSSGGLRNFAISRLPESAMALLAAMIMSLIVQNKTEQADKKAIRPTYALTGRKQRELTNGRASF